MKEKIYLSETKQLIDFKLNCLNLIQENVGAGKTTYIGKEIYNRIKPKGYYVILAPLKTLRNSIQQEHDFVGDFGSNKKVAMTAQKFFHTVQNNPSLWSEIEVLIIDEIDYILFDIRQWDYNGVFKNFITDIQDMWHKVLMIGMTATNGEDVAYDFNNVPFEEKVNRITFAGELNRYIAKEINHYSVMEKVFNDISDSHDKVAIFIKSVRSAAKQKKQLEEKGYKVHLLVSDTAQNYRMNDEEIQIKIDLSTRGYSELTGDILIFNSTMERGISIKDTRFTDIIIHNSNKTTQTQVLGRFRFNGIRAWFLYPKDIRDEIAREDGNEIELDYYFIPKSYLNRPLTVSDRDQLAAELNLIYTDRRTQVKWTGIKKLIEPFYQIEEKRIMRKGERFRVVIITKRPYKEIKI